MKKICIILAMLLLMLVPLSACGRGESESEPVGNVHSNESTLTDDYIVKDGATDYKIVIPENAGSVIDVAVGELQKFFLEATSIELECITDKDLPMSAASRYFSLGETSLLERAGIEIDEELLGSNGAQVTTKNKIVYMYGATDYGTLYAVYEFLHDALNYEFYFTDCYRLDKNVRNLPLKNFAITEVPDIEYRVANYGYISEDTMNLYRMRVRPYSEYFVPIKGMPFHNSFEYIKDIDDGHEAYWYSDDKTQLCYTAHGNEAEYNALVAAVCQTMEKELMDSPDRNVVTITIEDTSTICTCDACKANVEKYGADSASIILFCNDVNKEIRAWFNTEEGKEYARDLEIIFFAYQRTVEAPARYNESTGKYEGVNGIKCDEGVSVFYAPIGADYTHSFAEKENNDTRNTMEAWRAITNELYLWTYSTDFRYYLAPYDTFNSMQEIYRYAVECKTRWLFDQAQHTQYGSATGWSVLKGYLNSKLAWNVNLDFTSLIKDFFTYYFGPASDTMYGIFNSFRTHSEYQKTELDLGGVMSCYLEIVKEEFWPKVILMDWYEAMEQALEDIAYLETSDPEAYASYRDHITTERLSVIYLLVELYSYNTSLDFVNTIKTQFYNDATRVGLTNQDEASRLAGMYASWGI